MSITFSTLAQVNMRDVIASRPAPAIGGRMFACIDDGKLYRDSGEVWEVVALADGAAMATISQTGTAYTFHIECAGKVVESTNGSATTFTIPPISSVAWQVGTCIEVFQYGAGQVTIAAGAGVTLRSDGAKVKVSGQYGTIGLRMRAADEWVLSGDLA